MGTLVKVGEKLVLIPDPITNEEQIGYAIKQPQCDSSLIQWGDFSKYKGRAFIVDNGVNQHPMFIYYLRKLFRQEA